MISHNEIRQRLNYELFKMLLRYHHVDGRYCETEEFRRLFKVATYEISKNNTDKDVALIIHQCLKYIFLEPFTRVGVYKHLRYVVLPVLWKDHVAIERRKQRKLSFLAEVLDEAGRHAEAHLVKIIVKPYIRDLNLKWRNMSALDKVKALKFV